MRRGEALELRVIFFFFFFSLKRLYESCENETIFRTSIAGVDWSFLVIMHQSFIVPAPMGPGNSGAFNFSVLKALLNALHCGDKFMVKSLLKAPATRGGWQKWRTTNALDHLNKLSSPIPWRFYIKCGFFFYSRTGFIKWAELVLWDMGMADKNSVPEYWIQP